MSRVHDYSRRHARAGAGIDFDLLLADGAWARTVGLLADRRLDVGIGLLIPRCASVHTVGMRFAIDVCFVCWPPPEAERVEVLSVRENLRPGRAARLARGGAGPRRRDVGALELAAGEAGRLGIVAGKPIFVATRR